MLAHNMQCQLSCERAWCNWKFIRAP